MSKFEKLIEYIVNEEDEKARELMHDLCVEKSRKIYESLLDEEDMDESENNEEEKESDDESELEEADEFDLGDESGESEMVDGSDDLAADDIISDIDADEAGIAGVGEGEESEDMEDRVVDLEDALDELEAKFEEILAGEEGEEHMDDEGTDGSLDSDDEIGMEFDDIDGDDEDLDLGDDDVDLGDLDDESEIDSEEEPTEESLVREYKEKVKIPSGSQEVGKGGSVSVNTKSPVAKSGKGSVKIGGSDEKGNSNPKVGDMGAPDTSGKGPSAPKPVSKEEGSVNKKSVVASSTKKINVGRK